MELSEIIKKTKKSLLVLTSLGMVSGVYANELSHLNVVYAVKNHDGVCEIETKSGEFSFNANGKEITINKPMDLIQIIDLSGSLSDSEYKQRNGVEGARKQQINDMIYTIRTQLTDQDHVMLAFYGTNTVDSYAIDGRDGGIATRLLTKTEAIDLLTKINNEEQVHTMSQSWELIPKVVKPLLDGYLADSPSGTGFEDVYMSQPNRNKVVSVLQFTDDWVGSEAIDSSFAEWAKSNAKTFMTVVDNAQSNSSTSTENMKAVGHPNIKVFRRLDEPNRQETIASLFKSTAIEKEQPKVTINVTPDQGLTLKEVKLVSPDGKEENLAITDNRVNVEKDLPQDGKYTVKIKADGLVPETRKVTATATIGGKEVGKTELVFEGCKDDVKGTKEEKENVDIPFETKYEDTEDLPAGETKVKREGVVGIKEIKRVWKTVNGAKQGDPTVTESIVKDKVDKIILRGTQQKKTVYYRIVDPSDKVLKDNTKVSDGYKGAKFTVTKPTLAGYEIELKLGMHESGTIEGRDVIVDYVAYKLGKGVNARFVDEDGKELKAGVKVKDAGLRNGTKYGSAPEPVLEKDGLKYVYSTLGKGSAPANGVINDNEQVVTFVYKKAEGKSVKAEFVKKDTADKLIDDLIIKPEGTQVGTPWSSSHKNELMKDGLVYVVDAGLPVESGKVTDMEQVLKYNYVAKIGQPVKVRYMADNLEISGMEVVSENAQVGSGYEKEVVQEIKKDGKLYRFVGLEKVEEGMQPKADEPKVGEPKAGTPKGDEPKNEKPTDGKPTVAKPNEESKPKNGEAPKQDTPKADAPKGDEPKAVEGDVIEVDSKSEIKDRQFKGIVNNHEQVYVAKYVEVKPAPVKVNFVDENGKELKAGINLLKADTLLDSDYKYDAEKRIKVGDDEYALVGVTLDGKDVKEIKGKFGEKEQVYTAKYKKVVKPAPAKLPKTSGVEGYAKTQVATGLTVMGILGLILSFFGYRRKVNK